MSLEESESGLCVSLFILPVCWVFAPASLLCLSVFAFCDKGSYLPDMGPVMVPKFRSLSDHSDFFPNGLGGKRGLGVGAVCLFVCPQFTGKAIQQSSKRLKGRK